ncbi:MAG UNVERIFIED_CONTAM: hypothetical protein LVT10_03145 [Anaerolineae bacterium]
MCRGGTISHSVVVLTSGFVFMAMGFTFFNPADNLRKILITKGRDIEEVMKAITELASGFGRLTFSPHGNVNF